jgi:3D (Asp-Asp-Asp) domain-containing protein
VGAVAAVLGPQRRPGELLALPPAVVVSELRVPPLVVRAAAPAADVPRDAAGADAARADTSRADSARAGRRALSAALGKRARAGERIRVKLTAYCLRGTTRRGNRVRPGIAAADPKVFPLARYVEVFVGSRRLGRYLIDDTGGAVRGPHLDLWTASCKDARRFGRRRGTAVLVMRGEEGDGENAETRDWIRERARGKRSGAR